MFRYLAFVWDAYRLELTEAVRDWECRLQRDGSWKSVLSAEGVRVWIADSEGNFKGHTLPADVGIVLGQIYERQRDMLVMLRQSLRYSQRIRRGGYSPTVDSD